MKIALSERLTATEDIRCGSHAGYLAHYKRLENACKRCLAAHNADVKIRQSTPESKLKRKEGARRRYLANPDGMKATRKKWKAANQERVKASAKAYRLANSESVKEYAKRWNEKHPEFMLQYARLHRAANREMYRVYYHERRARERNAPSEPYTTQQILEVHGTDCHICKEPIDLEAARLSGAPGWERGLHLDHVVALVRGGTDLISNVKPSHGLCNLQKHDLDLMRDVISDQ